METNDGRDGRWVIGARAIPTSADVKIDISRDFVVFKRTATSWVIDYLSCLRVFDWYYVNAFSSNKFVWKTVIGKHGIAFKDEAGVSRGGNENIVVILITVYVV